VSCRLPGTGINKQLSRISDLDELREKKKMSESIAILADGVIVKDIL
jgi:hypothetical protein